MVTPAVNNMKQEIMFHSISQLDHRLDGLEKLTFEPSPQYETI